MDTLPPPAPGPEKKEVPEKYIRTYANDMEAFKKGTIPGLTPLHPHPKEKAPETHERIVIPQPSVPKEESEVLIHENFVVPDETPIVKQPPPPPPAPPPPPPMPLPGPILKPEEPRAPLFEVPRDTGPIEFHRPVETAPAPIKTYTQDFRDHVEETHASTVTVLAAQQDAAPKREVVQEPENTRGRWYVVLGVFLLLVGGFGTYIAYTRYLVKVAPVIVAPTIQTPIFVDTRTTVLGSGDTLMQAFVQVLAKPIAPNTVALVSFDASTTRVTTVFSQLNLSAPNILLRDIDVSGTMAGVVHAGSQQSPFFILSVASYSTTFSGMLSWEPAMQRSLAPLFPLYPAANTTTSTSTSASSTPPIVDNSPAVFRDETIQNHDVRVYRDSQGRSILLYGYWNQNTLIIARDSDAFKEILTRLATSHS